VAYVRRKGNQLAIVVGERDPQTKKVEQRVLFTVCSKPEALEAIGKGDDEHGARRFEGLLEDAYPGVKFDWQSIRRAIRDGLSHLPVSYDNKEARLMGRFKEDLVAFARALMLADPQHLVSAGAVIEEHRAALGYVRDLIAWRLEASKGATENEWNRDNAFFWRYRLQWKKVPTDIEEHAAGLWERRDLTNAEAAFRMIATCFPEDAEAWNYLGLIALERKDYAEAERRFRSCVELGRKMLPKRVARSSWWRDLETRPYMRGLRNLTLTLIRAGRYEEAEELANRLERECADDASASVHRAAIALNTGRWRVAAEDARRLTALWPEEGLVEAFALFENGQRFEALAPFIHAAVTSPRATRIVLGMRAAEPKSSTEARDWNAGVDQRASLHGYLGSKGRQATKFFVRVLRQEQVARIVDRAERLRREWFGRPDAKRIVFDELTRIQERALAEETAQKVAPLLGVAGPPAKATPARPRRARTMAPVLH
jgi:tetratricopeptide (TPR) repeat protein